MEEIIKKAEFVNEKRLEEWKVDKISNLLARKNAAEADYKKSIERFDKEIKEVSEMTRLRYDEGSCSYGKSVSDLLGQYSNYITTTNC
jgi:hypothetical protein